MRRGRGAMAQAVRIEGIEEAVRNFQTMSKMTFGRGGESLMDILRRSADLIRDDAKARAPYREGLLWRGIRSGEMTRKHPPAAFVGVDYRIAPHAHLIEFGTVKMRPQEYFKPAVEHNRDAILGSLIERCSHLIQGQANNLPKRWEYTG